jgi:hypothetical protein
MATHQDQNSRRRSAESIPGNARDREMGREGEPLGDRGQGNETWKPPAGEQGISNRPDDEGTETDRNASPLNAEEQRQDGDFDENAGHEGNTVGEQKGGDRSNRAAHSGATGERSTSGGQNKPEPKNQDEKGIGHPRNRS